MTDYPTLLLDYLKKNPQYDVKNGKDIYLMANTDLLTFWDQIFQKNARMNVNRLSNYPRT